MGRTKVTVHGVSVDIAEDRMGTFFTQYGKVEEVSAVISKAGIVTSDTLLQVTLTRKNFVYIPHIDVYGKENAGCSRRAQAPLLWGLGAHGDKKLPVLPTGCPTETATTINQATH